MQTLDNVLENTPFSTEAMIAEALTGPMHVDELAAALDLPLEKVSATLMVMQLNGTVRQMGGMSYELVSLPEETHKKPAFDIGGIILPHAAQEDIQFAKSQGQRVIVCGPERGNRGACPNCLGMENVMVRFVKGGPYQSVPQTTRPQTATWLDGAWYRVESKYYPCPACSDPRTRIEYLFSKSGLEPSERSWRIDYVEGMDGKIQALVKARSVLAQVPVPFGWSIFYGNYGRGKSGLLKAIAAQCIVAGVSAVYLRAADLLREVRSTYSDEANLSESDIVDRYGSAQVLAIDEIDRISTTNWAMATLMMVMDMRYNRRETHCTLMATNSDPNNMPAGFEYLASRMRDGDRIPVGGKDLRG